jgi:hypothetical protein
MWESGCRVPLIIYLGISVWLASCAGRFTARCRDTGIIGYMFGSDMKRQWFRFDEKVGERERNWRKLRKKYLYNSPNTALTL